MQDNACRFYAFDSSVSYVGGCDWLATLFCYDFERDYKKKPLNNKEFNYLISECLNRYLTRGSLEVVRTKKITDTGLYFSRINRGEPGLSEKQIDSSERADEVRAYENIIESLLSIFRTVEPEKGNFKTYGNSIRELLIIACTEVEYLLKKSLVSNNKNPKRKNYNTSDYIWCLSVYKLNKYSLSLPAYPALGIFKPFKKWNPSAPTSSIFWYESYNQVKHDRGGTKSKATLEALINAIAAIHILLESQYGKELFEFRNQYTHKTLFNTVDRPSWGIRELSAPVLRRQGLEWSGTKSHP